ncbi:MAG: serine/threonine-protein phosphatase [Actinomycetota bacterium]|nr:serine/threonine-protein phosphatase [Actinomycetota bacterium]
MSTDDVRLDLRGLLAAVEAAPPIEVVDVVARELAVMLGATEVRFLIANLSGNAVARISHVSRTSYLRDGHNERTESIPLSESIYQQVLSTQELHVGRSGADWSVLLPVTERGDAIGILELTLPQSPDDESIDYLTSVAHALSYVLATSRRHTDLFEWAQRDIPFSLAAEIQRRLLPSSYTLEGGPFTLAGWMEPAANIGGDTFDYSLDREYLYASITDAMGHDTEAALLATLAVGSLRNTRRSIATPAEQAQNANLALLTNARMEQFVTGHVLRIRLADGQMELVNAGHPHPYLLRDGQVHELVAEPGLPLGLFAHEYDTLTVQLEPGDRLLFVTDGFLERNAIDVGVPSIMEASAKRHPREVVRELASNVLEATGHNLRDDATVLCIDWYGPAGERAATGGASRDRATR